MLVTRTCGITHRVATKGLAIVILLPLGIFAQERGVRVVSEPKPVTRVQYRALVIGNNRYAAMAQLTTAVNDAREISRVLRDEFGFETELLLDADRGRIMRALNRYRRNLKP